MPKQDLNFRNPIANCAGMLGFAPIPGKTPDYDQLGAFFTNPVSLLQRHPADQRCATLFPGGVLLHSGFPNPGLVQVFKKYHHQWQTAPMPVILHLMVDDRPCIESMLKILQDADGIAGLEISFRPGLDHQSIVECLTLAASERPVIAQLDLQTMALVLPFMQNCELNAVSVPARRGRLPSQSGEGDKAWVKGRLFGPALFPQALVDLEAALQYQIPVIMSGGITSRETAEQMIKAGAFAVQVDTVLWGNGIF